MSLTFKVQAGGDSKFDVPPGMYRARLEDVKEMPPSAANPDWGPSLVWEFEVLEGEHTGKRPSCFTPVTASTANGLGRLLQTMLGRKIQPGEDVDVEGMIGQEFQITVSPNKAGTKNRVNAAFPVNKPAAVSAQPGAGKSPPPAKSPPPKPKGEPADGSAWMMHDVVQGEYVPMTARQIKDHIQETKVLPADIWVYPDDGRDHEPVTAKDAGFKEADPF